RRRSGRKARGRRCGLRSAGRGELEERIVPRGAGFAATEQQQTAMHAVAGVRFAAEPEAALAGRTHALAHPFERLLVADAAAALVLRLRLLCLARGLVALQRADQRMTGDRDQRDADRVADVA